MSTEIVIPAVLVITIGIISLMVYLGYSKRISMALAVGISVVFLVFSGGICWKIFSAHQMTVEAIKAEAEKEKMLRESQSVPKIMVPAEYRYNASIIAEAGKKYPKETLESVKSKHVALDRLYFIGDSVIGNEKIYLFSHKPDGALEEGTNVAFFCKPANPSVEMQIQRLPKYTPILLIADFVDLQQIGESEGHPTRVFMLLGYYAGDAR